ncbi:hypothetical protein M407DRAFT_155882 [Tulasnella calospora MUT 4182]|uniref:Uncharacterized protein n=1 Tax=Tulasnella calospora MUT 4182 TaxID=1051891 RepID=A0A0C3Q2N2_9AGAM|nr:hypothetical protein M407DRAFT_183615 [Tulasnella calospora MUT 4182]KIO18767.1 hypothetical protein M407DRAFT_155882 [Tulasnella calospora MUT 4182]
MYLRQILCTGPNNGQKDLTVHVTLSTKEVLSQTLCNSAGGPNSSRTHGPLPQPQAIHVSSLSSIHTTCQVLK